MEFIHRKQIIHCDLTSKNIFLDKNLNPKIGDFGFAKYGLVQNTYIGFGTPI